MHDGVANESFNKFINNAIQGAETGDDLAAVALLLQGSGFSSQRGEELRTRIMARVDAINRTNQVADAVKHSRGIGEALLRLASGPA